MNCKANKNTFDKIIFILGIVSIAFVLGHYLFFTDEADIESLVSTVLSEATEIVKVNREPIVYEGKTDGQVIGYAVLDKATGYQSEVNILTGIDIEGKIIKTVVVEEQETPTFFRKLYDKNFFEQFIDKDITEGFSLENVDAVSGSTYSSNAVIKAINLGTNYVGENYLNKDVPRITTKVVFGKKEISIILLMVFAVYATYKRKAKIRNLALVFSILVLGFWYNSFISYAAIGSILTGSVPNAPENLAWYILVGGAFILILFTGKNLFCFWLCPFGAFQEMLHKISGISFKPSKNIDKYAKYLRGFLVWLALVLALASGNPTAASYEPFATLFSQVGSTYQWALLPFVLITSFFIFRFWCNYFCPVGYVLSLCVKLRAKGSRLWKNRENGKTMSS